MTDDFVAATQLVQTALATVYNGLIRKGYKPEVVVAALAVTLGRATAVTAASPRDLDLLLDRALDTVQAAALERWEERRSAEAPRQ